MNRSGFFFLPFLFLSVVTLISGCQPSSSASRKPEPPVVTVSHPIVKTISDYKYYTVSKIDAIQSVEIRARISGYLDSINFVPGTDVKEGDLLFVIDPRPYQAVYDKAKSEVQALEARLIRAKADNERAQQLISKQAISKEDYDRIVSTELETEAGLAGAKASLSQAETNLSYTQIKAPFGGRISRNLIDRGNLVSGEPTPTLLTNIVDGDTVYVYFDIDEPTLLRLMRENSDRNGKAKKEIEAIEDVSKSEARKAMSKVPLKLRIGNDTEFSFEGSLDFIDNQINRSTGTLSIRGKFPSPDIGNGVHPLVPGGHGEVRVPVSDKYQAILIAPEAVQLDQNRKIVFVVNEKNQVVSRPVKLGDLFEGMQVITEGLSEKDQIIVNGFMRVRPGSIVKPEPAEMPGASSKKNS